MALLNFPVPTQIGDQTTQNGNTWQWNGTSWVAFNSLSLTSQVTGILAVQYGGTGFGGTYNVGDILYASSSNTFSKLSAGTAGSVLASGGPTAAPYWKIDDTGAGTVGAGSSGGFAYYTSATNITSGTAFSYIGGPGVGGTGATVVITQSNLALIGSTITSGTWAGTAISLIYGGTNGTRSGSAISYQVAVYNSTGTAITQISSGTANSVLFQVDAGTAPAWVGLNTLVVGGASTAANINGGSAGNLHYQTGSNTTGFVTNAAGSGASVLTQSGNNAPAFLGQSQLVVGGATTAASWANARTISLGTDLSGSVSIDGSSNVTLNATIQPNSVALGTDTAGQYASTIAITGNGITATAAGVDDGTAYTIYSSAVSTNTNNSIVYRDASGNFSAGIITASLSGTASTSTNAVTSALNGVMNLVGSLSSSASAGGTALQVGSGLTFSSVSGLVSATGFSGNLIGTAVTATHYGSGANLTNVVNSLSAGNGYISVSSSTGTVTVANIGVQSLTGTANQVLVSATSGAATTGVITLTTPQDIGTNSQVTFDKVSVRAGTLTTTSFSSATDIVNKQYVDNLASGLDIHGSVRVVIASAIGGSYYQPNFGIGNTATGAYITSIGNSDLTSVTFDGKILAVNQRVLVNAGLTATGKTSINGSALVTPSNSNVVNGIYYVGSVGSGSSQWYLYRALDTDDNTELTGGTFVFVEEGNSYADTGWVCANDTTNSGPIQFGSTAITFTQFTGAAAFNIGQGLTKVGNTIATKVNLSSTGTASGIGYTQFNIGGASVGGVADTGYYPTFSVRAGSTVAGSALLTLNNDGFSLIGATGTPRTLTVTGGDITLNGGSGNTLTLTGSISLPSPTQYAVAFGTGSALQFVAAAGNGASVLTQTINNNPVYLGQSQLVVGGATTAASWVNARTISLGTDLSGSVSIDGSSNVTLNATIQPNSVALGTDTTGQYASTIAISGSGITATAAGSDDGTGYTIYSSAVSTNTSNSIVYRDASGNFSAGIITASLTGTASIASSSAQIYTESTTSTRYLVGTSSNSASSGSTVLSTGSGITIGNNILTSGAIAVTNTTTASSTTTGALVVTGGVGIGGSLITASGNTSVVSGVSHYSGSITAGTWAGTAVTLLYGGTNGTRSGSAISYQVAVYNSTGTAITQISSGTANSVLFQADAATAPTWVGQSTLSVGSATNATNATNSTNVTTVDGTSSSIYLVGNLASSVGTTQLRQNTSVYVNNGTITANLTGTASTATRVGITTTTTSGDLPIVFASDHQPSAALGSSTLLTFNPSTAKITNGIWAGTAITTRGGGTGFNTVNANQILMGAATGNTWAAVASTNIPVVGIGSNPPAAPLGAIGNTQAGQLWWDSNYGVLKVFYNDGDTSQWVDATPVLGSSGGGSSTKRSYVMTFGAGFTPSTGADTVQILIPYAPDNTSKYYYIKRLDYRANTAGTGVSFYIERFTGGNAAFDVSTGNRIHSASGASFVTASGTFITSYTQSSSGASFVSSSGLAGSVISGDYLRLNFSHINSAALMSVSMIIEEQ
jgi:hypothetical protein